MDFFNNYRNTELESSSGNTQKEYDVVSEGTTSSGRAQSDFTSSNNPVPLNETVLTRCQSESNIKNVEYDEDEIEYDDSESDSENSESTDSKEICNIVAMKKELEYLKLKESIQVYKNKIIYNDMEHLNKINNLITCTNPYLVRTSLFYNINKSLFVIKEKEQIESYHYYNTMLKIGIVSISIFSGYFGIFLIGCCKT